ncbi:hypothetical protein CC2G_012967 [Coprinopsis cinerea AmutBmut pab1-1]|nr:hypothetical protein CC2G_012967 [Coprinopsis cinerea AmutBmut pab1-1]
MEVSSSGRQDSFLSSAMNVFTAMCNTPMFQPESNVRPRVVPMKTFQPKNRQTSVSSVSSDASRNSGGSTQSITNSPHSRQARDDDMTSISLSP